MVKQIRWKLQEWKHVGARYKAALKALSKFWFIQVTPEEEEEHGLAVMDAVFMVGIGRLRLLSLAT